jgi:hypothetical protein
MVASRYFGFNDNTRYDVNLRKDVPLIPDLRIYTMRNVSREHGRKVLKELEADGKVRPEHTATGRRLLTIHDAEVLADAL